MRSEPRQNFTECIAAWPYTFLSLLPEFQGPRTTPVFEKRPTKNQITNDLRRLNWLHQVTKTTEAVLFPDFWHEIASPVKHMDAFWEATKASMHLHVIVPSTVPVQFIKILPPYFAECPYPNVHFAAVLGNNPDDNAQRIAALQKTPSCSRGLLVNEDFDPSQLGKKPPGIDFVIVCRSACGDARASSLPEVSVQQCQEWCAANGIAFVRIPPDPHGTIPGGKPPVLPYPFPQVLPLGEPTTAADTLTPVEESSAGCDTGDSLDVGRPQLVVRKVGRKTGRTRRNPRPSGKRAQIAGGEASDVTEARPVTTIDVAVVTAWDQKVKLSPLGHETEETQLQHFRRLDGVARAGMRGSIDAGFAFMDIRDLKLWREGGFDSWDAYCETIIEFGRSYVNRLIGHAALCRELLEHNPPVGDDGNPMLPAGESLSRQLKRIKKPKQRSKAWCMAVKRAGGMPTAKIVSDAVGDVTGATAAVAATSKSSISRKSQRAELMNQLRTAVDAAQSWELVRELVEKLSSLNA